MSAPTRLCLTAQLPRRHCLGMAPMLILGVLLSAGSTLVAASADPPFAFDKFEVVTGLAARQTILSGFFLGGTTAELAALQVDEHGTRQLRIFTFAHGSWEPAIEATLRPAVRFVEVANIGGRDRLITYERSRVNWFDPGSASERALFDIPTPYRSTISDLRQPRAGPTASDQSAVPRIDIARDLNRDGHDDLVMPDLDGFWMSIQMSDGVFADPVKLGPPEPFLDEVAFDDKRTYSEAGISPSTIPAYLSRIHQMDYDGDGRSDLVFWNGDHFDVHRQDDRGLFSPVSETFTTDVPFDADGTYSLSFGFGDQSKLSLFGFGGTIKRTVLHSFRDMNGDGIADLVTQSLEGRGLLRLRTAFAVHFGTPTPSGISFTRDFSTLVQPSGRAPLGYTSQWLEDFDGDGRLDILFGLVHTGIGGMVRALLNTSITTNCTLYRLEDDDMYSDRSTAERKIKTDVDVRGGREAGFWPVFLVGDVNGDGSSDLLVGRSREELLIFSGGPDLLARQPHEEAVAVPGSEQDSWLVDLNKDGKQDILMHHRSATEPHRVTILIAR